jgi:hypothetical protein
VKAVLGHGFPGISRSDGPPGPRQGMLQSR